MVDEYEKTLQELHVKCVENHEAVIKAEQDKKITSHLPKAMVINKQFNRRDELEHSSDEEDKSAEPEVQKELEENDKIENSDSETETVVFDAFPKRTRSVVSKLPKHIGGSPVTRRQINAMGDD
ncbi:condensin complex non-SMC subunit Cnd1 [Batrachochytrium dendrobatidis]